MGGKKSLQWTESEYFEHFYLKFHSEEVAALIETILVARFLKFLILHRYPVKNLDN